MVYARRSFRRRSYPRRRIYRSRRVSIRRSFPKPAFVKRSRFRHGINKWAVADIERPVLYQKIRYFDEIPMSLSGTDAQNILFYMNSAYDPHVAFGGGTCSQHQMMIDAKRYKKYMVLGVKYSVVFKTVSPNLPFSVAMIPQLPGATTISSAVQISQLCHERSNTYAWQRDFPIINTAEGQKTIRFSRYFSLKKLMGRPLDPSIDSAALNATPSNSYPRMQVLYYSTLGTPVTGFCWVQLKSTYYVKYFEKDVTAYTM